MDTSKPAMFWKDTAASEFNIAVVTSFQVSHWLYGIVKLICAMCLLGSSAELFVHLSDLQS